LDLDTIYNHNGNLALFEKDDLKFVIGKSKSGLLINFPRDDDGKALIPDHRNDNNIIIAQIQMVRKHALSLPTDFSPRADHADH